MFLALRTSEQRRAERSRNPLVLMFLKDREATHPQESILRRAAPVLALSTRETDLVGWAEKHRILAVIFTQVNAIRNGAILLTLRERLEGTLRQGLGRGMAMIVISWRIFPEDGFAPELGRPVEEFKSVFPIAETPGNTMRV